MVGCQQCVAVDQMGLSSLPSAADAFFPFSLLAYALLPVALLVDGVRWGAVVRMIGFGGAGAGGDDGGEKDAGQKPVLLGVRVSRIEFLRRQEGGGGVDGECCVCLRGFEGGEEVSQVVACRHFFHRECLERWLSHLHSTCPLCRSMVY